MNSDEITQQILGAWDEVEGVTPTAEEEPEAEQEEQGEGAEAESSDEEAEETSEEELEDEEPADEEEPDEAEEADEDDEPEVKAELEYDFLADPEAKAWFGRYQNDPERALKGAWQLEKAFSRQGADKGYLERRVKELESQLTEVTAFQNEPSLLSSEQQAWVGEALESGNPSAYVREAVKANEFGLARVICNEWGREAPYDALRASQVVDAAEQRVYSEQSAPTVDEPINVNAMFEVLVEHFPDMPQYEQQMLEAMQRLGPSNHNVVDAQSSDPETAARGIINLYEIARASTHTVAKAKREFRNGNSEEAASKRKKAVVSSAEASPTPGETPRSVRIAPGLTLDAFDAELQRNR